MTHQLHTPFIGHQAATRKVATQIGNTQLLRIKNSFQKPGVEIYAKLEWQQLGGSVKARPAFQIIKEAMHNGQFRGGKTLLDATSGNTGIAYASIGAILGIPVSLCLPENASKERKQLLEQLGAALIYTSRFDGTDGAQQTAQALAQSAPDQYYYADQYTNPNNWRAHYLTTANEIWYQTKGRITHFVNALGTTGTFTGTSRRLKELNPSIQTVALQSNNPMHGLEGWKHLETAVTPAIYDSSLADRQLEVDTLEAYEMIRRIAQRECLLVSPSAAANLLGAIQLAEQIDEGVIVTTFADDASKYSEILQQLF